MIQTTVLNAIRAMITMIQACFTPDPIEDSPICPAISPEKKPCSTQAW